MELTSSLRELVTLNPVHSPFGSSLSASLACLQSRRLSTIHFHSPYYSLLALDRIDAFSSSYIVPKASHPAVASNARFGRRLLEEQEVMSDYQSALQLSMRLRVAHKSLYARQNRLPHKNLFCLTRSCVAAVSPASTQSFARFSSPFDSSVI